MLDNSHNSVHLEQYCTSKVARGDGRASRTILWWLVGSTITLGRGSRVAGVNRLRCGIDLKNPGPGARLDLALEKNLE